MLCLRLSIWQRLSALLFPLAPLARSETSSRDAVNASGTQWPRTGSSDGSQASLVGRRICHSKCSLAAQRSCLPFGQSYEYVVFSIRFGQSFWQSVGTILLKLKLASAYVLPTGIWVFQLPIDTTPFLYGQVQSCQKLSLGYSYLKALISSVTCSHRSTLVCDLNLHFSFGTVFGASRKPQLDPAATSLQVSLPLLSLPRWPPLCLLCPQGRTWAGLTC